MNLTIEQALRSAVSSHQRGDLEDAERLYRTILQSQPTHPDANHNLGVIAFSANKIEEAIPLFKMAIDANANVERYWLSYIDALIKTGKRDDVFQILTEVPQTIAIREKLRIFRELKPSPSEDMLQKEIFNGVDIAHGQLAPAIELRELGKLKEAQEWLISFLSHESRDPEALSLLSQVLLLDNRQAAAEDALNQALSINSELPSVYRNQSRLLLRRSKASAALKIARLACEKYPADLECLLVLAACLTAENKDHEALPMIEKVLIAKANYAEAYASRALIKVRKNDLLGAIRDAETAVAEKPHLNQMWELLGSLYYKNGRLQEAVEALRVAQRNTPTNVRVLINLGEFLCLSNKSSEAIEYLEEATRLAPQDEKAWTALGNALNKNNKIERAIQAHKNSLDLNPHVAASFLSLGIIASEMGDYESALEYLHAGVRLQPNHVENHIQLGNTLKQLGRIKEAEAEYREATKLNPNSPYALFNLGDTLSQQGELDEAVTVYLKATTIKPDYVEAYTNLGNALKALGRFDEAEATYHRAIASDPAFAIAHNNLGVTLQRLGRLGEALDSFTQAIQLSPNYAAAHNNMGNTLSEMSQFDKARDSYNKAIDLNSENADVYNNLGSTLLELGALSEAEARFKRALELRSDYDRAHYGLAKVLLAKDELDLALESIKSASSNEPDSNDYQLLQAVVETRQHRKKRRDKTNDHCCNLAAMRSKDYPLITHRSIDSDLISVLYEMKTTQLNKDKRVGLLASGNRDPRYGNGEVSPDFKLFEHKHPLIQELSEDLTELMSDAVESNIYIYESFLNILRAGGGTTPHTHLNNLDKNLTLGLGNQKFSMVYYLSVGDQDCREPGILRFFDPDEAILPKDGMILIFPACRVHAAVYGGRADRIMIGVNFYGL